MARNARLVADELETPSVVTAMPSPPGAGFAYDAALNALDAQMSWIAALDTKAGILLGGDGIVASLVFTKNSLLASAPKGLAITIAAVLVGSLVLALAAFATRNYESAPNPTAFVPLVTTHAEGGLKWAALASVLQALEINEPKIARKAAFLFWSGAALMVATLLIGGYFVWLFLN